jgi:hypothetical protein
MNWIVPFSSPREFSPAFPRSVIVVVMALLTLVGCVAPGEMAGREPFHIRQVTVRLAPGLGATSAFPERLKSAILEAAALWHEAGKAKHAVLTVSRYQIYRPGRVLVHGAGSIAVGRALVLDQETGRTEAVVEVLGAIPHAVGATGRGGSVNRSVEEAGMAAALAENLMLKLRGPAAIKTRERRALTQPSRTWDPVDGKPPVKALPDGLVKWDHGGEMACLTALDVALSSAGRRATLPSYCRVMGYRLPGETR